MIGAFVAGGVGLASIVVGAVTGGLVFAKKSTVSDNCIDTVCNAQGKDAVDQASTLALVSDITFGVGLAGVAAGVVLYLLAPSQAPVEESPPAAVGLAVGAAPGDPRSATVGIQGAW